MAWRNIWRNKMRSLVIMFSITVGLFAGIDILALYRGMINARIRTVIDAEVGHLQIHDARFTQDYDPKFIVSNGPEALYAIRKLPAVKAAAARSVSFGMLATATGSSGVQINGILLEQENELSQLDKKITEGNLLNNARKNEVLIGKKLAKKMKLKCRSKLVLTFTDTTGGIVSGAFRVAGIYQSANAPLDERNVYIRMVDMNSLLNIGASFHEIAVLLKKDDALPSTQRSLEQLFPRYKIENWKEISPETDLLVKTTNQLSFILMAIIMLALAFGIINTMLMAILERTREIGMMVALGTTKIKIFLMVLLETTFLTLAGAPLGILIGWMLTEYYAKHGLDLSGMGREMMSSFGYSTTIYPEFPSDKFVGVLLIVFATAIVSSLLPAKKALQLQPVQALRR